MEENLKNIKTNVQLMTTAISDENVKTEKAHHDELLSNSIILENLGVIEKIQAEAEKEFREKWEKILLNQSEINNMLKRPGNPINWFTIQFLIMFYSIQIIHILYNVFSKI